MVRLTKQQRQAAVELLRRNQAMEVTARPIVQRSLLGFDKHLSVPQRKFIEDPSRKVLCCAGRRGGKTFGLMVKLLQMCLGKEGALCWFIAPSRERAKMIMWAILKRINVQYRLQADFNDSDLSATFPTGSVIRLTGVDDLYDANKFRGIPADLFIIDEASTYREAILKYLIEESIGPAMDDFEDAQLILAGRPGNTWLGYFHDADIRNNVATEWSCHHWTILENEFYERWRNKQNWQQLAVEFLQEKRDEKGWSETNPTFKREYLAEWCSDGSSFYYSFDRNKNIARRENLPSDLRYVIGCDFGHRIDPTALVVLGYNEQRSKDCYVVESRKLEPPRQTQMEYVCKVIKELSDRYRPDQIVGDYAGGGTYIFEGMAERYEITINDAQKKKKSATTEFINSELHEGRIKIADDQLDLIGELQTIRWDNDRKKPDPVYPNDLADAFQYGFSEVYAYLHREAARKKSLQEQQEEEMERYWQEQDEKMRAQDEYEQEFWQ